MDDQAPVPQAEDAHEEDSPGEDSQPKAARRRSRGGDTLASSRQLMALAHELWVVHLASPREIESQLGISRFTLRNWRQAGNWDRERAQADEAWLSLTTALRGQLAELSAQLAEARGQGTGRQMELHALIRQALDNTRRTQGLRQDGEFRGHLLRFLRGLMEYLRANDIELARALLPHVKPFARQMAGLSPTPSLSAGTLPASRAVFGTPNS